MPLPPSLLTSHGSRVCAWPAVPQGHYCLEGTVTPTPCPLGTAYPGTGGNDIIACNECIPGYMADLEGTEDCEECNAGTYQVC